MSNDFVRNLAVQQRQRLVAGLMEHFEKRVVPALPANVRSQALKDYRDKVMSSVGQYHDVVLDCLKASVGEVVVNEEAMRLLEQVHQVVTAQARSQARGQARSQVRSQAGRSSGGRGT